MAATITERVVEVPSSAFPGSIARRTPQSSAFPEPVARRTPQSSAFPEPVARRAEQQSPYSLAAGLLATARPYQWAKNVAVLIIPGLAIVALGFTQIFAAAIAFAAFSLAASSVYFLNDTLDRESDRQHPTKRFRPIASGAITPPVAIVAAAASAAAALAIAVALSVSLAVIVLSYLLMTAGYSLAVKHLPIADVTVLAAGFVLRVLAGAVAVGVAAPPLLLLAVFSAAVLVAFGKRRSEAVLLGDDAAGHRPILRFYTVPFLERSLIDSQLLSVAFFAAWIYFAVAGPYAIAVSLLGGLSLHVALGAYRRSLLTTGGGGDPTRELASNPIVMTSLAVAGLTALSTALL